jgi:HEAT repeat protein
MTVFKATIIALALFVVAGCASLKRTAYVEPVKVDKGWSQVMNKKGFHPELKARLLQWEAEAPPDVKREIDILRESGDAVGKEDAAARLNKMGKRAQGAILVLIETFRDTREPRLDGHSPAGAAARALGKIGDPAVEPLIAALEDENSDVRFFAAVALKEIKDPRAVDPLIGALKDENPVVREYVAGWLGEIKDPRAVEALIAALKDKDSVVRASAMHALGAIGDPRAVAPLIAALKRGDWGDRESAAYALGEIKDPRAFEPLIAALKDNHELVRKSAAHALGETKDPRAVEHLIGALKDKDSVVRASAARVLGGIKDRRAVEPLIETLKDSYEYVRFSALEALRAITGEDFGLDHEKWKSWWAGRKGSTSLAK